jgi:ribA/ribD-fused uncharacterized protein
MFSGAFRFLSNFWPAKTTYEGVEYPTSEHAYQAAKFTNPQHRKMVRMQDTPQKAKNFANHNLRSYRREDWDAVKLGVMEACLRSKFDDDTLRRALLATGDSEIIEGNTWNDTYWGVCRGVGENHLGKLLMKLRAEYREGSSL